MKKRNKKYRPKQYDLTMGQQPWKQYLVWEPLEEVLRRIEIDGTVDACGAHVVFNEQSRGEWYDLPAAISGVAEFHRLVASRHGIAAEYMPLQKMANKLSSGVPLFEQDIIDVRRCMNACRSQIANLKQSEVSALIKTVQISAELEKRKAGNVLPN